MRFRIRTLMILVLVIALGVAWIVRARRVVPVRGNGGGCGGQATLVTDVDASVKGIDVQGSLRYWGKDAAPHPIRWQLIVTREASAEPLFQQDYGDLSVADPGPATGGDTVFQSRFKRTVDIRLAPGRYRVGLYARDGLKMRDQTGKIVDRNRHMGGGFTQYIYVHR